MKEVIKSADKTNIVKVEVDSLSTEDRLMTNDEELKLKPVERFILQSG